MFQVPAWMSNFIFAKFNTLLLIGFPSGLVTGDMCSLFSDAVERTINSSLQLIPVAYLRVLKIIKNPDIVLRVQNEGSNPNPTSRVSHGIPFSIQGYPSACSLAEIRVTQLRSAVAVLASHKALPLPGVNRVNRVNRSRRNRGSGGSASLRKQLLKNLPGSNHVTRKCEKNIEKHHWKNSEMENQDQEVGLSKIIQ
jgi:hypothetical protein